MGGIHLDLDVKHGRQPAQSLGTDTQRIDLVAQLNAQFLDFVFRAALFEFMHV